MKYVIGFVGIISAIIMAIIAFIFAVYMFIAFLSWIFSDPYNLIQDVPQPVYENTWRFQRDLCIEKGGVPKKGAWSGLLKECIYPPY